MFIMIYYNIIVKTACWFFEYIYCVRIMTAVKQNYNYINLSIFYNYFRLYFEIIFAFDKYKYLSFE